MILTAEQTLAGVKERLSITDTASDDTIEALIADVKAFAQGAGCTAGILATDSAIGMIAKGVADLWEAAGGKGSYSPIFTMRLIQLRSAPSERDPDMTGEQAGQAEQIGGGTAE